LGPIATTNWAFLEWGESQANAVFGPELELDPQQGQAPHAQAESALPPEIAEALQAMKEMAKIFGTTHNLVSLSM
jgi:hypothetical protein